MPTAIAPSSVFRSKPKRRLIDFSPYQKMLNRVLTRNPGLTLLSWRQLTDDDKMFYLAADARHQKMLRQFKDAQIQKSKDKTLKLETVLMLLQQGYYL